MTVILLPILLVLLLVLIALLSLPFLPIVLLLFMPIVGVIVFAASAMREPAPQRVERRRHEE